MRRLTGAADALTADGKLPRSRRPALHVETRFFAFSAAAGGSVDGEHGRHVGLPRQGASANVVTAGLAEKAGYPVSFNRNLKVATIPKPITVVLSMAWLLAFEM